MFRTAVRNAAVASQRHFTSCEQSSPCLSPVADGYLFKWTAFNQHFAPVLTSMPTMTMAGNHERDYYYNKNGIVASSGDWLNNTKSTK